MSPSKLQSILKEALAQHKAGRAVEAEKLYRQARLGGARNFDAWHLSGALALQVGRAEEAVTFLAHALVLDPKSVMAKMRLAMALLALGRAAEAEKALREIVQLKPDFHEGWDKLAYCLKTQDRLDEALACHQKVATLKPDFAVGWYNFGLTLAQRGREFEALGCHDRAMAADPNYALARFGRAQILHRLNRVPEAVEEYRRFLAAKPDHHEARSNLLFALHALEGISREELFAEHVDYGRRLGKFPEVKFAQSPEPDRRLRVAILSADLREHSCAYFLEPLLQHLDRAQFELYLYHDHFREDQVSDRLRALASVWRNFVGKPAALVEKTMRADQPDLLIDLAGHTALGRRLPLMARRLAPVQVTYLGYPNTTGVEAMDYRLTDSWADPEGEADMFATERLVRFAPTAWTYSPPANAPEVKPLPALSGKPLTFGCFNNLTKLTDAMLRTWAKLLQQVPDSRLLLKGRGLSDPAMHAQFRDRLSRVGLPVERVTLLERSADTESHLAQYHQVDIALDTFPYHGTTTTCEALWMGAPVISLAGDRHMSRVGVSLLNAVGHPEWIAENEEEYVRLAVGLAAEREKLAAVRSSLRDELGRSPLLSHASQADHFGRALRGCWRDWCKKQGGLAIDAAAPEFAAAAVG